MLGFVQARSLDIQNGLETALGLKLDWGRSVALGAFALLEISYIFLIWSYHFSIQKASKFSQQQT